MIAGKILTNKYTIITFGLIIVYFVIIRPLLNGKNGNKVDFIRDLNIDASKVTISSVEAKKLAGQMYSEMDGVNFIVNGEFWKGLNKKVATKEDAKLIFKAFGLRDNEDLMQWLKGEISLYSALPKTYKELIEKFTL